jgi:hypothetical protein
VCFGDKEIQRVDYIDVLGSRISMTGEERCSVSHRVAQSYKVLWKWGKLLLNRETSLVLRVKFWTKTVAASMLWGLETTRSSVQCNKILQQAQRFQVAKMMGIKRRKYESGALEEWLEWHIRRMREAKRVIRECGVDIVEIMKARKTSYAAHIARFGLAGKELHLVKRVLLWRSLAWWREQQSYNDKIEDHFRFLHTTTFGKPRRWETQFGKDWMLHMSKDNQDS